MARNAEKAMTALARWRRMKEQEEKGPVARRPHDVLECKDLKNAERFRREVTMDIAKKIALIQNPGLGEYKIRDLNDDINKQLRVKYAWEKRIKDLGGPDYRKTAPRELDKDGSEVAGSRGYKYFGAAKDLPGVRELFEQAAETEERIPRSELVKNVDADYYGYMCDDDGVLIPLEMAEEARSIASIELEWKEKGPAMNRDKTLEDDIYKVTYDSDDEEQDLKKSVVLGEDGKEVVIKHVVVPSQAEVEAALVERKKQFLLDQFVGSN
ncbi:hypothetical protein QR680_005520 [Steinernema hermaphroditum]|uniref:Pre-mRNA-splicing factor ISY1 homolog n=1 Tax=Steinernema hermaphroditum TaxID=289476 RepID=A0AA39HTQ7_9BILA|nr:hypothetical protein QR680_005520 [Steinernema hermaphroditum]